MVALVHPDIEQRDRPGLRLVVDNTGSCTADLRFDGRRRDEVRVPDPAERSSGLGLRLVDPAGKPLALDRERMVMVVAIAVVILGGLLAVRMVQGSPSSGVAGEAGVVAAEAPASAPGDQIVVARAGDSLWTIARSVAPDSDPRPIVAALVAANGGESVQIGQQIVIPGQLLD